MSIQEILTTYKHILVIDFLRYFIPASLAFLVFWVLFKQSLAHRFIQGKFPNNSKLWFEFKYSMSTVLIFALIGVGIVKAKNNGLLQLYDHIEEFGWGYALISLGVMILFHDFYFYWTHRWMHHPKIYKHVHKVHHMSTNPSPWAAYSFHPFEAVVQALVLPILLFTIPLHSLMVFIFLIYMIVRNVLGHIGFELFPKGFTKNKWFKWHTTTTHHSMHHQFFNSNYGLYFSWWDNWMKTTHDKYDEHFDEVTNRPTASQLKSVATMLLLLLSSFGFSQSPAGKWITFNESTGEELSIVNIQFDSLQEAWHGTIDSVILQPYQGLDPICIKCEGDKKNQKVIGMEFMSGFYKEGRSWSGGTILDPVSGDIYDGKIWFENDSTLLVRGYGGPFGLFYRTQEWIKTDNSKGITGLWKTIDDKYNQPKSLVELQIETNQLKGYIRELHLLPHEGNYPVCVACEDNFKDKPVVGLRFMNGFQQSEDAWVNGEILDPGNGQNYKARFWLLDNNHLKVRGYLGPFYRTQEWKRFEN